MKHIFANDIGLASILDAYGIPKRQPDPITREIRQRDGRDVESAKWWFDVSDDVHAAKAKELMDAYFAARDWERYTLDPEHPIYWMKGVLENRTANLHMFHHGATPMRVIENGERTVLIGPRASEKTKEILKQQL